jgi:hypothetical protein
MEMRPLVVAALAALGAVADTSARADLQVVSHTPSRHALAVPLASTISVTFDRPVLPASAGPGTFMVFGRVTGPMAGTFSFADGNRTVTFTPARSFAAGELVTVGLVRSLQTADGDLLRSAGYHWMFWTWARPATMAFDLIATVSNRTPAEIASNTPTRIYGANPVDLDRDGYPDLTTVNEDSNDLRVLLHTGSIVAPYSGFLTPFPISHEASPNEAADFNRDGKADLCAAATFTNSCWVVLGNGDGTFAPPGQQIAVGGSPHGIAVLDVEGDGDGDVVTSNTGGNNLSLMLNNGFGVFGASSSFDGGCSGEYGLNAADMNNDGIMDLVVACRVSQQVRILRGNGDGTFTALTAQNSGGLAWMLSCADVNGDGHMDVTVANSHTGNGSVLLGDGAFGLSAPVVTSPVWTGSVVATDLGDLDGDGDLDWVLSNYTAGSWRVYRNNGAGAFTFDQEISAVSNPSCAIVLDFDLDGDLDLALTDEIANVIKLERNGVLEPLSGIEPEGAVLAFLVLAVTGSLALRRRTRSTRSDT